MAVGPAKASRWGEGMARARPGRRARDTQFGTRSTRNAATPLESLRLQGGA